MGKSQSKIATIDSHFTISEIQKLEKVFKERSNDGTIDKTEFKNVLTNHVNAWSTGAQYKFLERLFDAFDLDANGRIDFEEFISGLSTFFKGTHEEKAELSFRIYDEDRNGKIEAKELSSILKAMYSDIYKSNADYNFDQVVGQIYSDFDINQDGSLTLEAFKIMSLKEPMITDFNMSLEFTRDQVATHATAESAWIIIDSQVLDITSFAALHPGGEKLILEYAGKDATGKLHEVLQKYSPKLMIGKIVNEKPKVYSQTGGKFSITPYGESSFFLGFKSPYFTDSHVKFRTAVKDFVQKEIMPDAGANDEAGKAASKDLYKKMGSAGILAARIGPGKHLKDFNIIGGVSPEEFDYFHEMIAHEEFATTGYSGYGDSLGTGLVIGLPPVYNFGKPELKAKVIPQVLSGEKRICLAISEPTAGSDVAAIRATAKKSPCGKYYIVNGIKKWITNGTSCDYFSTAVRTEKGISMLLIERCDGLETKKIKTSYSGAAGTALIIMEDVKVPVENLLGKENQGFPVIMYNFNHERWYIVCGVVRMARLVVEECLKWTNQRIVFGQKLIEQPVIRQKLAHIISQVEAVQNWLENITYQMTKMSYQEQSIKLAGPIALLKLLCTRMAHNVNDEACQIFGGRAITKSGMGRVIEEFQKTYKFGAILGGSEEIMADLGVRMAMKGFPNVKL